MKISSIMELYKRIKEKRKTIAMIIAFFYAQIYFTAYAGNASGTLGVCNIQNPAYDSRNKDNTPYPSEYNRVYFGWVPATPTGKAKNNNGSNNATTNVDPYKNGSMDMTNTPIYWRVLYTTANDETTAALFMLTEYALASNISWDLRYSSNGGNQRWQFTDGNTQKTDSSLRKFLQGSSCSIPYANKGLYEECFDLEEQDVMLATTKTETGDIPWINTYYYIYTHCI